MFFKIGLVYSDTQYGYLQMFIILRALFGSILVGVLFSEDTKVTKPLVMGLSLLMGMMFRATHNEYMYRVVSIVGMITKGGMPFGALVYGVILDRVEIHWTMLSATLLISCVSVAFLISLKKEQSI
ncbi:MAG: hypothetical protein AB2421_05175 [Thermotaleaceae bacterium]